MKDSLSIKIEKINGLSDEHFASAVFSKRITTTGDLTGNLVGCILAKDGNFGDLQTLLHGLFEIFADKLEGTDEGVGERMKEATNDAKNFVSENKLEINYAVCFFYKRACFIVRNGNKVKIWAFKDSKAQELSFDYGSGPYSAGQLFVLGTEKFFSTFDTSTLENTEGLDIEEVIDGLATEISSDNAQSEIGVAFVKIGKNEEEISPSQDEELKKKNESAEVKVENDNFEPISEMAKEEVGSQFYTQSEQKVAEEKISIIGSLFANFSKINFKAIFKRKTLVILAILVFLGLGISGFWSINSQKQAKKQAEFKQDLDSAKSSLAEAEGIIYLNSDKARSKLTDANSSINRALGLFPKDAEANSVRDEISSKLKETENVAGLPFKETVDTGDDLVSVTKSKNGLVGISKNKIFEISKEGKVTGSIDGLQGAKNGYVWDNIAFLANGEKIAKVDLASEKKEDVITFGNIFDISVFLGNVYVLGQEQITKFVPIEKGYSDGTNYLDAKGDFGQSSRFAIDGIIWVTKGNQILKFNRGKKEDFAIQGLAQGDVSFGEIYTNSDIDNIYVVDTQNGALLVFKKDGTYQKAYQAKEFKNNPSMIVDEASKKVYITSGSKILEAGL